MDTHVTHMINTSWKFAYAIKKVGQLFNENIVSKIVSWFGWMAVQSEKNIVSCCRVVDASATLNDV